MNLNESSQIGKSIKLIIFDLDGVLMDSRELHYEALNRALEAIDPKYVIQREEHLAKYDGRPTTAKLNMLTQEKGLPLAVHDKVWNLKQEKTFEVINETFQYDNRLRVVLSELKKHGFQLFCASNSIFNTLKLMLLRKGLLEYFDYILSCEDVGHPKPAPDIYVTCCLRANVAVGETLILEDSHVGRKAALLSGCHLLPIENPESLTLDRVLMTVNHINRTQAAQPDITATRNVNIVIPMAASYDDYLRAGFQYPAPLVEVNGQPMVQMVIENLNIQGRFIFVVKKEHYVQFHMNFLFESIAPGCKVVVLEEPSLGQAMTVLAAKDLIDNDDPVIVANCNQFIEWDSNEFLDTCSTVSDLDGAILTFKNVHPRYSYVNTDAKNWITNIEEKKTVSDHATAGVYYMKHGRDLVKYLQTSIVNDSAAVNGSFYVSGGFQAAIAHGKRIKAIPCKNLLNHIFILIN